MTHDNAGLQEGRTHKSVGHSTGWLALKMDNVGGVFQHAEDDKWEQDSDIDGECAFSRFGGVKKFHDLAFKTHAKMVHHPNLAHFFPETIDMEPITIKNARFMCDFFGGPKYGGPSVQDAHSFLKITHEQYDDFMAIFKEEIQGMRCRDKAAVKEIVSGIGKLRKQIVDPKSPARAHKQIMNKVGGLDADTAAVMAVGACPVASQLQESCPMSKGAAAAKKAAANTLPKQAETKRTTTKAMKQVEEQLPPAPSKTEAKRKNTKGVKQDSVAAAKQKEEGVKQDIVALSRTEATSEQSQEVQEVALADAANAEEDGLQEEEGELWVSPKYWSEISFQRQLSLSALPALDGPPSPPPPSSNVCAMLI